MFQSTSKTKHQRLPQDEEDIIESNTNNDMPTSTSLYDATDNENNPMEPYLDEDEGKNNNYDNASRGSRVRFSQDAIARKESRTNRRTNYNMIMSSSDDQSPSPMLKCWGIFVVVMAFATIALFGYKQSVFEDNHPGSSNVGENGNHDNIYTSDISNHNAPLLPEGEQNSSQQQQQTDNSFKAQDYNKNIEPTKDTISSSDASSPIVNPSSSTSSNEHPVKYNPNASLLLHQQDPFQWKDTSWYGSVFVDPPHPSLLTHPFSGSDTNTDEIQSTNENVGYIQFPDIYNNTIVFCSEGDVYLTTVPTLDDENIKSSSSSLTPMPAMRLTSTVGNVLTPKLNPKYPYLLAFTATYTGHREAYLMDLRYNHRSNPSMRLTYMDSEAGVIRIVGWEDDGESLVISAYSMDVSLPDVRLFKIGIIGHDSNGKNSSHRKTSANSTPSPPNVSVSSIIPVPLSQAIDSATVIFKTATSDQNEEATCRFFTRYKQSSNTARYVGGTAENLWAYCDDESEAIPLTADYHGTSTSPQIYKTMIHVENEGLVEKHFLLFMSDRELNPLEKSAAGKKWIATTMNLWAMEVPTKSQLYGNSKSSKSFDTPFKITSVSCDFDGLSLREYAVDTVHGNIVLRIGADLHMMYKADIDKRINAHANGLMSRHLKQKKEENLDKSNKPAATTPGVVHLPIAVYSDFNNLHERLRPLNNPYDVSTFDCYQTSYGTLSALMTARGQLFVNPVIPDTSNMHPYGGGGMNMPPRRYRVAPGMTTGGMVRILGSWYIPNRELEGSDDSIQRIALVLATDPSSPTAEMAFYLLDTSAESNVEFTDVSDLPKPIVGGNLNGGSVADGGLGSINVGSVTVSPCGRRVAWTNTDGHIVVMTLPDFVNPALESPDVFVLPQVNENNEPVIGVEAKVTFSPAGRYIAVEHSARNQFRIISIADLDDPENGKISLNRFTQATSDRFNSMAPFFGRAQVDFSIEAIESEMGIPKADPPKVTTLYFLSDRDIILAGNSSPWGARAPSPYFAELSNVYALPLISKSDEIRVNPVEEVYGGQFTGGGASELSQNHIKSFTSKIKEMLSAGSRKKRALQDEASASSVDSGYGYENLTAPIITPDIQISFGDPSDNISFARRAYLMSNIPTSLYIRVYQLLDDPALVTAEIKGDGSAVITIFTMGTFPDDSTTKVEVPVPAALQDVGLSTNRGYMYLTYSGITKVFPNTVTGFSQVFLDDMDRFEKYIVDTDRWYVSIWPKLEYQQMYSDAWRLLRDYYYDPKMGQVDWPLMYHRYLPLVSRCGRREELDDVLKQLSSELSALHVFVYGGEYNDPMHGNSMLAAIHQIASLGVVLERSIEWSGYIVKEIPQVDPDFNPMDGHKIYSPLSHRTLRMTGQSGLLPGDVIVGVNGESVINVPDIHMMLRGAAGRSIRLNVLRITSESTFSIKRSLQETDPSELEIIPEPVIAVPITQSAASNLRYASWEWKTRQTAKELALKSGFTVGYMHLRSMSGKEGEDAFVRGLYPDYDKQGLIIDVRHNVGGNIDSWLLDSLQRKAWMYFQGRATNITNGGLGWDEQFAFRGHIVVLIDEMTSSDGEGKKVYSSNNMNKTFPPFFHN